MKFIHRLGGPCCGVPTKNKKQNNQSGDNTPEPVIPSGPVTNNYAYVDLGLPSGTLWATMNVGAVNETDYGLYFQWGDVQGYTADQVGTGEGQKAFTWADYKYSNNGGSTNADMIKYNSEDGKTVLDSEDDAVTANWGGDWHTPTVEQYQELLSNTTKSHVTIDNINGYLLTSKNDSTKTLFMPANKIISRDTNNNDAGDYLTNSLVSNSNNLFTIAKYFSFSSIESGNLLSGSRYEKASVRGVIG